MKNLTDTSFLFGSNSIFVEELYNKYLQDPASVDSSWQEIFKELPKETILATQNTQGASWSPRKTKVIGTQDPSPALAAKLPKAENIDSSSDKARMLIEAYRSRGHFLANLDPLNLEQLKTIQELDLAISNFGFDESDYHKEIKIGNNKIILSDLVASLQRTYCQYIAAEFMHLDSPQQKKWFCEQFENQAENYNLTNQEKQKNLQDLLEIENFENFLHVKFPGTKRFSIEGGASSLGSLETIISESSMAGVEEIIIGMAHRGRLNVLTKVVGKSYVAMLSEFQGNSSFPLELKISGDVKYHMGYSGERLCANNKKIYLSLAPNPSHLEAVNPVVMGKVRAKQKLRQDFEKNKVIGILIHGDAAFAGQGVVAETLSFAQLDGYNTGGTIHIVINNQIGFTTNPSNAKAGRYSTEFAKIINAPILHVNGDHPEEVAKVSKIAAKYREKFQQDIVIDVVCYRLYGHNEGDEPMFTQPIMYKEISNHQTVSDIYAQKLISEGILTKDQYSQMIKDFRDKLEAAFLETKDYKPTKADWLEGLWSGYSGAYLENEKIPALSIDQLKNIGNELITYPSDFNLNAKILRQLEAKKKMLETGEGIDWATGEALAFASLLKEGYNVRLSGQDVSRGTFSHRHSVFIDQLNQKIHAPLNHLSGKEKRYEVVNSNLSEYGVLGFEYGYSQTDPRTLTIWEGQFGDFANGAQIMIDQFISSAEQKWLRLSGLVMLLPHGFEGQGPEHSSARLERFLQLCAQENMIVANCSSPASYYHILRRQLLSKTKKPLIIMSPKSLLRHKLAISNLSDLASESGFMAILPETEKLVADLEVKRLVICSGKVYYDLYEERQKNNIKDVAIIRMEQFYPFPEKLLSEQLAKYKNAQVVWCQEEPKNMGAWFFVNPRIEEVLVKSGHNCKRAMYVGREEAASPAVGYLKIHNQEQAALVAKAIL